MVQPKVLPRVPESLGRWSLGRWKLENFTVFLPLETGSLVLLQVGDRVPAVTPLKC